VKFSKGLTIVELVVVIAIIGLVIALSWGPMFGWPGHYRFEAAGRAFINAAQSARIQAISGLPVLKVSTGPPATPASIQKVTDTKFKVYLDTITFVCDTCGTLGDRRPTTDELPIKVGDYVALTGFNQPDYLNGNLFKVTALNPANPTVTAPAAPNDKDMWGHLQWQITGLSFECESCAEFDSSACIKWTDTASSFNITTGKVMVAACVKFIKFTAPEKTVPYSVIKNKTGSTIECYYDPDFFDVKVRIRNPVDGTYPELATPDIIFDYAGATKNRIDYFIGISRVIKGEARDDAKYHAIHFNISPAGKIRFGLKTEEVPHS